MLTAVFDDVKLAMWEKREVSGRTQNPVSKKWEDDGTTVEKTLYTFKDEFGEKLEFLSDNELRKYEGEVGSLAISFGYNSFERKNQMKFGGFVVAGQ